MKQMIIKIVILVALAVLVAVYLNYENTTLQISNHEIKSIKIPKDFNNYKIIQISDFHNTKSKKLSNDIVNNIKAQKPNLIVITGDLIDSRRTDLDIAISFLEKIVDVAPIYYVTGNHESRTNKYEELKELLNNIGVNVLDDKVAEIKINQSSINLIGIDDPAFAHEESSKDKQIVNTKLNNFNYNEDVYNILLSHRPELFELYVNKEIDLVFTGHAHGGQIRIPFIGGLVVPNQGLFPKYTSGIYCDKETKMVVNRGIGNSLFPFRINNRPELIIVTLNSIEIKK